MNAPTSQDTNISCFNEFYNTSYTKEEIGRVYWLCDIYKLKTPDAIKYLYKCHHCGTSTDIIGHEYCGPECKQLYIMKATIGKYVCAWGNDCKMCNIVVSNKTEDSEDRGYYITDDLNYSDGEKEEAEEENDKEVFTSLKIPSDDIYMKPEIDRSYYVSSDEDDRIRRIDSKDKNEILSVLPINNHPSDANTEHIFKIINNL